MDILKFTLKGRSAFFKMPEVNTICYFTYGNIHKVALLGIFGAILGYRGYAQMDKKEDFPEFYEKLKGLSVSVAPTKGSKGYIQKKIQSFNNSVGYASQEQGGNLIVKEQWLDNPKWDIYVKLDCDEAEKLKESLMGRKTVYVPYLGSNDHPADIEAVEILDGIEVQEQELEHIDSLFSEDECAIDYDDDEVAAFKYQEYLPIGLVKETNLYELKKMLYTNLPVLSHSCLIYSINNKNIVFY
jgi:CRISPR-associated protein Cas5h